ncbi:MAG: MBL fold metallo-hydrolase, partial [Pirellulaceae bacterium]|nr:MBL fold metallo-hydrolase [Pirellulaceae bacterium]
MKVPRTAMDIHLLGSTGYHPNQRRHTFCLMMPEIGVVVDAGTALFRARPLIETDSLDILLTHAHLDHVVGLTFLYDVLYGRSLDRVTVHGQLDKLQAIEQHLFAELIFPVAPPFQSQPLAEPLALGGAVVTWFPLSHPGGSVGYRFDWEQASLAIVTDTTAAADAEYIEHIRGVDLLIHECYFGDEYAEFAAKTGHSHT